MSRFNHCLLGWHGDMQSTSLQPISPRLHRPTLGATTSSSGIAACRGWPFPARAMGLVVIDSLIKNSAPKRELQRLDAAIGMFYGDVLTHTIPGSHWEVVEEGFPEVRISSKTSISVIHVAQRRLDVGVPTLAVNYDHTLDVIDHERL